MNVIALAGGSRPDQAGLVGGDDELGPVPGGQLGQQVADVGARGGHADVLLGRDLAAPG